MSTRNDIDRVEGLARILAQQARVGASAPLVPTGLTGTVYVDPQNVTGVASDTSPPVFVPSSEVISGPVFRTSRGVVSAWGTYSPLVRSSTSVVFLSNHTDNSDPVVMRPIIVNSSFTIRGTSPVLVSTATLSGTVPKNRGVGSNSLLQTNLGPGGSVGLMVENITHPSRAFVYRSTGGNSFELSQPMALQVPPNFAFQPPEVDTWTDGDSVKLLRPIAVNLVDCGGQVSDFGPSFTGALHLYQMTIFNPAVVEQVVLNSPKCHELISNRGYFSTGLPIFNNCYCVANDTVLTGNNGSGSLQVYGGVIGGFPSFSGCTLDGDVIVASQIRFYGGVTNLGFVYMDGDLIFNGSQVQLNGSYGGHVLYGRAGKNLSLNGTSHAYNSGGGTFAAALTAPGVVGGVLLNGIAAGASHAGTSPDVFYSGIAVTPNSLDAPAGSGGFGGNAFNPGGASISNQP